MDTLPRYWLLPGVRKQANIGNLFGLKGLLQRTAHDLQGNGWDYDKGYGVIDAAAAVKALGLKPSKAIKKKQKRKR